MTQGLETQTNGIGPRYTSLVQSLPASVPFVGPETQERARGGAFLTRLGANENAFGPSPRAIDAMQRAAFDCWKYGDPENHDLRHALAQHHGIDPDCIVVGEGIDGLLGYLCRLLVGQDTPVVTSLGAYPTLNYHAAGFGACIHTVPYLNDHEDPDALIAKASAVDAALIYFANPDNPMGTWHDAPTVQRMIDAVPDGAVLCLDEAYGEFAPVGVLPALDTTHPRVIRMRTFSKAYGMAGARIGYAIAHPDLILAFNKVRNHFGVSRIAQAGALAALKDQNWLDTVVQQVSEGRDQVAKAVSDLGLKAIPSATNFMAVVCGDDAAQAQAILSKLNTAGHFIRMPFVAPQNRCIRISIGKPDDLTQLTAQLAQILAD